MQTSLKTLFLPGLQSSSAHADNIKNKKKVFFHISRENENQKQLIQGTKFPVLQYVSLRG